MKWRGPIVDSLLKGRFSMMLLAFTLMFLVMPLIPEGSGARRVYGLLGIAILISCIRAISKTRGFLIFMLAFTVVIVVLDGSFMLHFLEVAELFSFVQVLKLIYYSIVFFSIMHYVLDSSPVTIDKVCGALSAYFLMGFVWSVAYTLFQHVNPASFNLPENPDRTWATYLSFTTLSTLGYGDITPQTVPARGSAVMEAVFGQIFLAVIVARLIALQISSAADRES